MKNVSFTILLCLISTSCSWPNFGQQNTQPKIRIVDLKGNSHPVMMRVPELNNQALSTQGITPPTQPEQAQQGEVKYQSNSKNYQDQNIANAEATQSFPSNPNPPQEEMLGVTEKEPAKVVEYDLADPKEKKHSASKTKKSAADKKFFVQVGAFSHEASAEDLLKRMKKFHEGKIETFIEGEKTIHRVLIGPFSNKTQARATMRKIIKSGQDAVIVRSE